MTESESLTHEQTRFPAAGVASIIFAPPLKNYGLSAVTTSIPLMDAIALEWFSVCEEPLAGTEILDRWLTNTYRERVKITDRVAEYLQAMPTSSVTITFRVNVNMATPVRARRFPFIEHFDLLKSPAEGTYIDPDDFIER